MIRDTVIENNEKELNRTRKVFSSLDSVCYEFDLGRPVWLDQNIADFKRNSKVRFTQDSFIEPVDFDYLEFQVIEEE